MKKSIEFFIDGMTCAVCKGTCEKALVKIGCSDVFVNLTGKKATATFDAEKITQTEIFLAIEKAGFKPRAQVLSEAQKKRLKTVAKVRLVTALIFASALFCVSMLPMAGVNVIADATVNACVQMTLALSVMVCGLGFYTRGTKNLIKRHPNMDTLVAIGTLSAFFYSLYSAVMIFCGHTHYVHNLYFESSAVVVALVLLGKFLEERTFSRTSGAIEKLMKMTPETALLIRDGKETEVLVADVQKDDLLVLKAGMSASVDGVVVAGYGDMQEAILTGESAFSEKSIGDKVFAGTILADGVLTYRAESVGRETVVSKILLAVERAGNSKAKIEKITDRVASIFTPVVLAVSILAFIVWISATRELEKSISVLVSVLVISCPCALGLATPVAVIATVGRGAEGGVLFKCADVFGSLAKTKIVAFDKTGTLTEGVFEIAEIVTRNGFSENEVLALAAAVEKNSAHPLAVAIFKRANELGLEISPSIDYKSEIGKGVSGVADGKTVFVGKPGVTVVVDGVVAGEIKFRDNIRKDAEFAVSELKKNGIEQVLITGDSEDNARAVAESLGIEEIYFDVLPEQKAEIVGELQKKGSTVFVGDGINDAPALAKADAGVAGLSGTDISKSGADAVLTRAGFAPLLFAISLSKSAVRIIKENLCWAFVYNVVGIGVACGGFLNPMISAVAMGLSSVSVLLNALRLTVFKTKGDK